MKNKAISPLMATTLLVAFTLAVAVIAGEWLTYMYRQRALEDKVFVVFHDCDTGEYISDGYFNVTNGTIVNISISGNTCAYIYEVKR